MTINDASRARHRLREMFRRDPDVARAHRHTSYETVRHIEFRVARFRRESPEVQRAVLLLLRRDAITHEAGNRGVSASALVAGVANAATAVTAVIAAILAGYLGFADAVTPTNADASEAFISSLFTWVAGGLSALFLVVIAVWVEGGRRDRRRAMATIWHEIFFNAHTQTLASRRLLEDDAIIAWLRSGPTTKSS